MEGIYYTIMMEKKQCSKCSQIKSVSEFHKNKMGKFGVEATCKSCASERRVIQWEKQTQEERKEKMKVYMAKQKQKPGYKEREKNYSLKKQFGITLDDYNTMLFEQNGCCAICNTHHTEFSKALAVDHCHETGKVRGLLCTCCNSAIGKFRDDIELLKSAIKYLNNGS